MIVSPLFLIRARGTEFAARVQSHNLAWNEAKDLSFEHGAVELLRVNADGEKTIVARFDSGLPLRQVAEAAS